MEFRWSSGVGSWKSGVSNLETGLCFWSCCSCLRCRLLICHPMAVPVCQLGGWRRLLKPFWQPPAGVWATPDWSVARTSTDSREYAAIILQNVARRSLIRFSLTILQWCRCSAIARSYGRCADFNYPSELAIKSWVAQSMCTGENKRYLYGSEIYINSSSL